MYVRKVHPQNTSNRNHASQNAEHFHQAQQHHEKNMF